jgi:tetratricopeptide (TPR) repeat protein
VFDSVLSIRRAAGDTLPRLASWPLEPGEARAAFARALPPGPTALAEAQRAFEQAPNNAERSAIVGTIYFERQEYRASLPFFARALLLQPGQPDWLLRSGIVTVAIGEIDQGMALLERARQAGGDSVYAMSVMAEVLVGRGEHQRAADLATRAVRVVRPTIATPFPAALEAAVRRIATESPPQIAAPMLEEAILRRPSWDVALQGASRAYVRWGGTHCRRAAELATELSRFGWTDKEIVAIIRGCGTT